MIWVNTIAVIILFFSLLGGLKEGAVKHFFSLLALIIAIYISGFYYWVIATIISFLPGTNWENFIGFFIALGLTTVILHLIFLLPRKIIQKIWKRGLIFRLLGGALNVFNAGTGMVVLTLAFGTYPIIDWLARAVTSAGIPVWLVERLSFVQTLLPEAFQNAATLIAAMTALIAS